MARPTCVFEVSGEISDIIAPDKAVISFLLHGRLEYALLTNTQFYHDGRLIPADHPLDKYLRIGITVKFSCQVSNERPPNPNWGWIVTMCWRVDKNPLNRVSITRGLGCVQGRVTKLEGRHGILALIDGTRSTHRILFLASKFYVNGRRFAAGKLLSEELYINEEVYFDAIPCIPDENEENCSWFATCVFKGRRPKVTHEVHSSSGENKSLNGAHPEQIVPKSAFKTKCLDLINKHIYNTRTLYVTGRGMILAILDEEFGIIMGEFKKNIFQTMLFHRKNFFLFKTCLVQNDIRALLCEEDRVKFIAVGAPRDFVTDWIAVQVSIDEQEY